MSVINLKQSNPTPIEAAKALTKAATAADVRNVLKLAVAASLDPLDMGEVVGMVVERTKFKATDVRKTLKALAAETKLNVPDDAQALAKDVWEHVFGWTGWALLALHRDPLGIGTGLPGPEGVERGVPCTVIPVHGED